MHRHTAAAPCLAFIQLQQPEALGDAGARARHRHPPLPCFTAPGHQTKAHKMHSQRSYPVPPGSTPQDGDLSPARALAAGTTPLAALSQPRSAPLEDGSRAPSSDLLLLKKWFFPSVFLHQPRNDQPGKIWCFETPQRHLFSPPSPDNLGHSLSTQGWGMRHRARSSPHRSHPATLPDLVSPPAIRDRGANPGDG